MQPTLNVFAVENPSGSELIRQAITRSLDRRGFDILADVPSEGDALRALGLEAVVPSDGPAAGVHDVFIALDINPLPREARDEIPRLDNGRLRYLKQAVEDAQSWVIARGGDASPLDVRMLYTTNSDDAWRVVRQVAPERAQSLREEVQERADAMRHPFRVLRPLTVHGISARTDLIELSGGTAICKVFRPGRERHFQNELSTRTLASTIPAVTPPLDAGANWLVFPHLSEHVPAQTLCDWIPIRGPRMLSLSAARSFTEAVVRLHEAGVAHLDLHLDHVLIGPGEDVRIIDFEKIHRVPADQALEDSPMITGYRFTDEVDGVCGGPALKPFDRRFSTVLGAELEVFLTGSISHQLAHRGLFAGRRFAGRVANLARRGLGRPVRVA